MMRLCWSDAVELAMQRISAFYRALGRTRPDSSAWEGRSIGLIEGCAE
jgi:hypothetical protein